jgi:hypothetical protein
MDQWISRWNPSALRTFIERVPQLQTTFKSWPQRFAGFAKIKALALALFAVVMGIAAYNTCYEESSLAWVKSHFPSQIVWQASLTAEGLQLVKDPKTLAKVLRNLPARVESGNQAWEGKPTVGPSWWVIYPGKGQSDPLIFCRSCDQIPKKWQPSGEGWSGLESVLTQVRTVQPLFIAKREQKRAETLDPREIRY